MQAELPGRALYVVARDPALRARLTSHPNYHAVFENAAVAVYRIASDDSNAVSRGT